LWELTEDRRSASGRWEARNGDIVVRAGDLEVRADVKRLRSALARRLRLYRRGRRRIVTDPEILGGEPVFAGTRIPLRHVAGLIARGVPRQELVEDYPSLSADDLEFAALVARMRPDPGRPIRPLVLLRNGKLVRTTDTHVQLAGAAAD
jgi:uncharacterized protein (DUF433 family)